MTGGLIFISHFCHCIRKYPTKYQTEVVKEIGFTRKQTLCEEVDRLVAIILTFGGTQLAKEGVSRVMAQQHVRDKNHLKLHANCSFSSAQDVGGKARQGKKQHSLEAHPWSRVPLLQMARK